MLCEHANAQLVEYAANELTPALHTDVEQHLSGCDTCQADLAAIQTVQKMAQGWQEQTPPPLFGTQNPAAQSTTWESSLHPARNFMEGFRQWFPTFASATALVLVTVLFVQQPGSNGVLPDEPGDMNYGELPVLPQEATQAALVQSVLETSKEQRAKEIQAVLKALKAEMDKRSIQTEESLRYIISHQLQGQQEMDDLYRQVERLMKEELASGEPPSTDGGATAAPGRSGLSGIKEGSM